MKTKFNKITKIAAVGIFFLALMMNVKVSLTDPFLRISNDAIAQTSSSSSGGGSTDPIPCTQVCMDDPTGTCSFPTQDENGWPTISHCLFMRYAPI